MNNLLKRLEEMAVKQERNVEKYAGERTKHYYSAIARAYRCAIQIAKEELGEDDGIADC